MSKNLLVINVDIREIRVALIENGIIVELHIERESQKGTLGNIYMGKVSRVLPGMQAAFIDVGLERAAFLHVEDLIRPDDFEAYLAGHGRAGDDEGSGGRVAEGARQGRVAPPPAPSSGMSAGPVPDIDDEDDPLLLESRLMAEVEAPEAPADDEVVEAEVAVELAPEGVVEDAEERDFAADGEPDAAEPDAEEPEVLLEAPTPAEDAPPPVLAEGGEEADVDAQLELPGVQGSVEEGADGASAAPLEEGAAGDLAMPRSRAKRGRGRVRRSVRTSDRRPAGAVAAPAVAAPEAPRPSGREARREGGGREGREGREGGRDGRRSRQNEPPRVSKTTPIREVVREGQEVLVQISKEPIGTKGARVTSHISLPGRYVVFLPTVDHVGISKRIGSEKERSRLRDAIDGMKPPSGGLIVRTLAEGLTKKQLKADVGYLVRLWGEVVKKREEQKKAPTCLYTELDLVLKTARDLFTDDIDKIVIDDHDEYVRLRRFVEMFLPERVEQIELYEGEEPIFDAYGIEDEIGRALSRKVPLPSGGYLIIDQAEALTAIDVNTGRFVGKGSKDLEETILMTNLEAVEEIAYQLRFRNIGGLIILDLIDMERASNREKVRRKLEQLLAKDKAKTTLNRISELGLIEMTRKRTRESLGRQIHEPCFYCDGTGQLQSKHTIAYEILRQVRRERMNLRGYVIVVNAHPSVVDLLKNEERIAVQEAERRFQRRLELVPRKEYHIEQFDLLGR
jgi:ribonuclease G